jgi:hypothetical protein
VGDTPGGRRSVLGTLTGGRQLNAVSVRPRPLGVYHRFHSERFLSRVRAPSHRFPRTPTPRSVRPSRACLVRRTRAPSLRDASISGRTAQAASGSPAAPASVFRETGSLGVSRASACGERRLGLRQRPRRNGGRLEVASRRGARRSRPGGRGSGRSPSDQAHGAGERSASGSRASVAGAGAGAVGGLTRHWSCPAAASGLARYSSRPAARFGASSRAAVRSGRGTFTAAGSSMPVR